MKGIYALVISLNKDITVNVGALGNREFDKGLYVYVGSAQTGLEKRIARHLKKSKPKFWHIDYLLNSDNANVLKVFHKKGTRSDECKTAEELSKVGIVIKGFGSSDCNCEGHLFKLENYEFFRDWMDELTLQPREQVSCNRVGASGSSGCRTAQIRFL
jgi:Uri superfamily endonuclease